MSYNYQNEKPSIFLEENFKLHMKMRERAFAILDKAGACMCENIMGLPDGCGAAESWTMMAIIDYMVEQGALREIPDKGGRFQDRVFVKGEK